MFEKPKIIYFLTHFTERYGRTFPRMQFLVHFKYYTAVRCMKFL